MEKEEHRYLAAFSRTNILSSRVLATLIANFDSLETAWNASLKKLINFGIEEKLASRLVEARKKISPQNEQKLITRHSITVITIADSEYPTLLKEINDPPVILFVRGKLHTDIKNPLAVVGTRAITYYGKQIIKSLIPELVSAGCSIISGLALGCDGFAQEETLTHNGYTVAVLGSGVDDASIYPRHNYQLALQILKQDGAIISEYPMETKPEKYNFPTRNRIIAGLSKGVFIIEAAIKSGSLITARLALDYNRNVYAVPGSIFSPQSAGTNAIIASGAKLVSTVNDILEEIGLQTKIKKTTNYTPQNEQENIILQLLSEIPCHIEELAERSHLSTSVLLTCLTILETKRIVTQLESGKYVKQ